MARLRALHKNHRVLENSVGILYRKCHCGWTSNNYTDLLCINKCPVCQSRFDERLEDDLYCKNCGKIEDLSKGVCAKCEYLLTEGEEP